MTSVEGEMAGIEIGKQKTRALQAAATAFGLALFKSGDGPGGFNTLMAFHPRPARSSSASPISSAISTKSTS